MKTSTRFVWLTLVLGACSSEDSLGTKRDRTAFGSPPEFAGAEPCTQLPASAAGGSGGASGIADPSLAGKWVGQIDEYPTIGESRALTVRFDTGVVVFGDGASPPAPATDPNGTYPPGYSVGAGGFANVPYDGFVYPLRAGTVDGERVRFAISSNELWESWCVLQTSYGGNGTCSCIPNRSILLPAEGGCYLERPESGDWDPVGCARVGLCMWPVCSCDASGCRARTNPTDHFDLQRDGDELVGSYGGFLGKFEIRLTRLPE
ncbi:MAG: hypothetical protein HYZ29_33930 [Myxococcales bacterium]|nr:hypothetical protein [Myxococcales bacterium]